MIETKRSPSNAAATDFGVSLFFFFLKTGRCQRDLMKQGEGESRTEKQYQTAAQVIKTEREIILRNVG